MARATGSEVDTMCGGESGSGDEQCQREDGAVLVIENGVERLIKSRHRVRDLGEVFTGERQVTDMLDLVKDPVAKIETRVLEPACGDGNFLEEVLRRKLETVARGFSTQAAFEYATLVALSNIYGIDIRADNVEEARARMRVTVVHHFSTMRNTWSPRPGFYEAVEFMLGKNVIMGDTINGTKKITFVEFTTERRMMFGQRHWCLATLLDAAPMEGGLSLEPTPSKIIAPVHYLELANAA